MSVCTPAHVLNVPPGATAPRVVMAMSPEAECIRLPAPTEKDPVFGLTRSYLNTLILPSRRNGNRILVRSYVLLRPGNQKGVRLIDLKSLREYVHRHMVVSEAVDPAPIPVASQIREELPIAA
jgi:hypothetical protein